MQGTCVIRKTGFLTLVQDEGRTGYQKDGIIVSGVLDRYSFYMANFLVGNSRNEAVLEISGFGPVIEFLSETVISITGAQSFPSINDEPVPMWSTIKVRSGEVLTFKPFTKGTTLYISFLGGIDVPVILNSKSTLFQAKLGGFSGRKLEKGDILHTFNSNNIIKWNRRLHFDLIPDIQSEVNIRVILGPEQDRFLKESIETFLTSAYEVTLESNRMGYRLNGPILKHVNGADIYSDAVTYGTIQIPADGNPIILMSDRQTTGGYTRIGTVISVDLPKLAQLGPLNIIRFEEVTIEAATKLYIEQEKLFRKIELTIN